MSDDGLDLYVPGVGWMALSKDAGTMAVAAAMDAFEKDREALRQKMDPTTYGHFLAALDVIARHYGIGDK